MSSNEPAIWRNFSKKRPPIYFELNDQEFHCRKALGAADLQDAMLKFRNAKADGSDIAPENLMERLGQALEVFLLPESFQRFMALITDKTAEEPVDIYQLMEIFQWLTEQYTQRPSGASADSSTSPETVDAGIASPVGALPLELTP